MACLLKFLLFRLMENDRTERKKERKREEGRENEKGKEQNQLDSEAKCLESPTYLNVLCEMYL